MKNARLRLSAPSRRQNRSSGTRLPLRGDGDGVGPATAVAVVVVVVVVVVAVAVVAVVVEMVHAEDGMERKRVMLQLREGLLVRATSRRVRRGSVQSSLTARMTLAYVARACRLLSVHRKRQRSMATHEAQRKSLHLGISLMTVRVGVLEMIYLYLYVRVVAGAKRLEFTSKTGLRKRISSSHLEIVTNARQNPTDLVGQSWLDCSMTCDSQ